MWDGGAAGHLFLEIRSVCGPGIMVCFAAPVWAWFSCLCCKLFLLFTSCLITHQSDKPGIFCQNMTIPAQLAGWEQLTFVQTTDTYVGTKYWISGSNYSFIHFHSRRWWRQSRRYHSQQRYLKANRDLSRTWYAYFTVSNKLYCRNLDQWTETVNFTQCKNYVSPKTSICAVLFFKTKNLSNRPILSTYAPIPICLWWFNSGRLLYLSGFRLFLTLTKVKT